MKSIQLTSLLLATATAPPTVMTVAETDQQQQHLHFQTPQHRPRNSLKESASSGSSSILASFPASSSSQQEQRGHHLNHLNHLRHNHSHLSSQPVKRSKRILRNDFDTTSNTKSSKSPTNHHHHQVAKQAVKQSRQIPINEGETHHHHDHGTSIEMCSFCPYGLAQPSDFVLSKDYNATCGTFVDFAALLPASNDQCRDTQFKFVEAICCLPEREDIGSSNAQGLMMDGGADFEVEDNDATTVGDATMIVETSNDDDENNNNNDNDNLKQVPTFCTCSPRTYAFRLTLAQLCDVDDLDGKDGVDGTLCLFFIRDVGSDEDNEDDVSLLAASLRNGQVSENQLAKITIVDVQFLEFGTSNQLTIINQDDSYKEGISLTDGDTLTFESISRDLDPELSLEEQGEYVPGGVQVTLRGKLEVELDDGSLAEKVVNQRVTWAYNNGCYDLPVEDGDRIGWMTFEGVEPASNSFCPVAPEPTTTTTTTTSTATSTTTSTTTTTTSTEAMTPTKAPTTDLTPTDPTPTTDQESLAPASVPHLSPHFMTPSFTPTTPTNAKASKVAKTAKSLKALHDEKTPKSAKSKKTSAIHDAKAVKSVKSTKTAKSKAVFDAKNAKTSKTMISDGQYAESDMTSLAKREKLNRNHAEEDMSMSISSSSSSGGSITQITSTGKARKTHQPKAYKDHDAKAEKSSKGGGVHHSMPFHGSKGSKTTRESKATSSSKSSKAKATHHEFEIMDAKAKKVTSKVEKANIHR